MHLVVLVTSLAKFRDHRTADHNTLVNEQLFNLYRCHRAKATTTSAHVLWDEVAIPHLMMTCLPILANLARKSPCPFKSLCGLSTAEHLTCGYHANSWWQSFNDKSLTASGFPRNYNAFLRSNRLSATRTLADYRIQPNAEMFLSLALKGGAVPSGERNEGLPHFQDLTPVKLLFQGAFGDAWHFKEA